VVARIISAEVVKREAGRLAPPARKFVIINITKTGASLLIYLIFTQAHIGGFLNFSSNQVFIGCFVLNLPRLDLPPFFAGVTFKTEKPFFVFLPEGKNKKGMPSTRKACPFFRFELLS